MDYLACKLEEWSVSTTLTCTNGSLFFMWALCLQYYLEQNLEARQRELDREEELDARSPTVKAKSKMSKVLKQSRNWCVRLLSHFAIYDSVMFLVVLT